MDIQVLQRLPVNSDISGVDIVESLEEADDGCLATSRGAYDADALSPENLQVESAKDWQVGAGRV